MKRKNSLWMKIAAALLFVSQLLAVCACAQETVQKEERNASGEVLEETTLAVLGGDVISLEEAVFYTRMLQESWEYGYYEYYGEDLWQEVVNEEIGTLAQALKRDVLDALTEIHLYCAHAGEYGAELTEDEKAVISERAVSFMETNTPEVLEAAGATTARVEVFLQRNELAAKVAAAMQEAYEPQIDEEAARVGKLTYALFATTGTFDAQGNQTPFTDEELRAVRERAEAFMQRTKELGDISAAGEEVSHTVIDVYFNEHTDGGAHELVAEAARQMEIGGVSDMIEAEEGYYIVQKVSEYDEDATLENMEYMEEQAKAGYAAQQLEKWLLETPLELDEVLWETVKVEKLLIDPSALE